jgi:hypothetical protein
MSWRQAGRSGNLGSNPGTYIPLLYSVRNGPWQLTVPYARGTGDLSVGKEARV